MNGNVTMPVTFKMAENVTFVEEMTADNFSVGNLTMDIGNGKIEIDGPMQVMEFLFLIVILVAASFLSLQFGFRPYKDYLYGRNNESFYEVYQPTKKVATELTLGDEKIECIV